MTDQTKRYNALCAEILKLYDEAEEIRGTNTQQVLVIRTERLTLDEESDQKVAYELLSTAEDIINLATGLADVHGFDLDFSVAYGMGGTYHPKPSSWHESGWVSSSSTC